MKYEAIRPHELTNAMIVRWAEIQESDAALANPYFRPEFTQVVAAVRDDVEVGVLKDNNQILGFFPFHRKRCGVARPIGLGLSDYHGLIVDSNAKWTAEAVLRGCRLIRWEFDHLLASQNPFTKFIFAKYQSPIIDVSQGYEQYTASIDKSARKQFREVERKRAKLEDAIGPVKFIRHTKDQSVLRQMIAWKSLQCRKTGTVDYFKLKWCLRLIERIHASRDEAFGGMLSCLYAGEKIAAVHFSMYSQNVWHSWFPAYNDDLQEYSPGLILLYEMIRSAADIGIHYIDLGKGMSLYKRRVMTGGIPVAEGCAEIPSIQNHLYRMGQRVEKWSRQSAFKTLLRIPGRIIKDFERKNRYE
jgi:CelD/BcsL family acetyltransferase involved in cellulose biosynthesis